MELLGSTYVNISDLFIKGLYQLIDSCAANASQDIKKLGRYITLCYFETMNIHDIGTPEILLIIAIVAGIAVVIFLRYCFKIFLKAATNNKPKVTEDKIEK